MKVYFKGYKFKTALAVFLKFVEACFELILPLLMVSLINEGIFKNNQAHVYSVAIQMVVLTLAGYLASITCQYFASVIAQRVGGKMRSDLLSKLIHMDQSVRDQYDEASLIMRGSSDIDRIIDMIARTIRLAVRAPMIIFGSVVAMYLLDPQLSKILLAMIPVFVVVIALFMFLSLKFNKSVQKQWDQFSYQVREYLSGIRIIFAFNKAEDVTQDLKQQNKRLSRVQNLMTGVNSISSPLITFMMNTLLIYLVYLGALKVGDGSMNSSQILALINYCTQIVLTLIVFMNLVMIFSKGYASWQRVSEILYLDGRFDKDGVDTLEEGALDLVFENVSFSYPQSRHHVLNNVSFSINAGETLGIVGLTGSGKSTLLKLINRMYDPQEGVIKMQNKAIDQYNVENLRQHVGYIAQKPQFFANDLKSAISMDDTVDVAHYIKLAQGKDILNKGLEAPITKGAGNFSGGQRQRMSIARQLAKDPGILLFDDSFSALDTITDRNLRQALNTLDPKPTTVIVSQRTSTIMDADNIIVLEKGSIVAFGRHEDLLQSSSYYQKIHALNSEVIS